jgi:hypothetical protein
MMLVSNNPLSKEGLFIEGKIEIARTLLAKDIPLELTAEITGLPVEELKKLHFTKT